MYKVYLDGRILYYPGDEEAVIADSILSQTVNDSGTFTFSLPEDNPEYENIQTRISMLQVTKDDKEIFYGEVRSVDKDIDKIKQVYAVGELAFLFDSVQPQAVYHDLSPRQMLETWLNIHNSQVEEKKRFYVGIVTVHDSNDSLYRYTNQETTLDCIREKLCDKLDGYLRIRKTGGKRYLDLVTLQDYGKICEQPVQFGANLIDYVENVSGENIATACIPRGGKLDESPIEGLEAYTDITSVNSGKDYVYIQKAVDTYGWIYKVVDWDDVFIPANLKAKAEKWLTDNQYENMTLDITAVDASILNADFESWELGDSIHAVAEPFGMDRYFPVYSRELHLQAPEEDRMQLGTTARKDYVRQNQAQNSQTKNEFEKVHQTSSFLQSAIDNATQMMTGSNGGYKVTEFDEDGRWLRDLYMNAPQKEDATNIMQINMNGIGFSREGFSGPYKNAWTIDGVLAGEFIKAGTVQAEALSTEYRQSVQKEIENAETGAKEYAESYTTTAIKALEDKITLSVNEKLSYVMHDYVVNGDLADDLDGWTVSDAAVITLADAAPLGKCVKFSGASTTASLRQTFTKMKAGKFKVRFKAAGDAGTAPRARVRCSYNSVSKYTTAGDIKSGTWTQFEFEYDLTTDGTKYLYLYDYVSGVPVYIKDVELLGSYEDYNEAQITILSNSIESKVTKNEFGSYVIQHYNKVITAFNDSSKYVQISAGEIAIYDYGVTASKKRAAFDQNGNHFWRDGYEIGKIGTNNWKSDPSKRGLVFDLEYQAAYMCWAWMESSTAGVYTSKWLYASKSVGTYAADTLHAGCSLDMHNFTIKNLKVENLQAGGYKGWSGNIPIITDIWDNGDGTIGWSYSSVDVENGVVLAGP